MRQGMIYSASLPPPGQQARAAITADFRTFQFLPENLAIKTPGACGGGPNRKRIAISRNESRNTRLRILEIRQRKCGRQNNKRNRVG